MTITPGFGQRVKQLRTALNLSQVAFAKKALSSGASAKNIGRIEDESVTPRLDTLQKIAVAGGVPLAWLCTGVLPFKKGQLVTEQGVASRLRVARERKGLSPLALSRTIGLGNSSINILRLEKGTTTPRFHTVERIAAAVDVPAALLVYGN